MNLLTIIHDAINENIKQLIKFDMILCNKKTFIKALKLNPKFWTKLKEETLFDYNTPKPFNHMRVRLCGYLFGVNKKSESFDDDEFAFMENCQIISKYKDGKLRRIK